MSSRLFKHQMAMTNRKPVIPALLLGNGDMYRPGATNFEKIGNFGFGYSKMNQLAASPDGAFLIAGYPVAPYYQLFFNAGGVWQPVSLPVAFASSPNNQWCWSKDSQYLLVSVSAAPYQYLFKRNPNNTFTNIALPSNLTSSYAAGTGMNDDASLIAISMSGNYLSIAYRNAGGAYNASPYTPAVLPTATSRGMTWVNNNILIVPQGGSKPVLVYKVSAVGEAVQKTDSNIGTSTCAQGLMSPDASHIAMSVSDIGWARHEGNGVFTKLTAPTRGGVTGNIAFSFDSKYLAIYEASGRFLEVFRIDSDALVDVTPAGITTAVGNVCFING